MVNCLERDADLHMAQLMPLPLTFSCFSKIQIGFTFLVPAHRVVGAGNPKSNGVGKIIPESFHVLHVSARCVSQNLSAYDRHWRLASSQEVLGSYTSDKELLCRRLVAGNKR